MTSANWIIINVFIVYEVSWLFFFALSYSPWSTDEKLAEKPRPEDELSVLNLTYIWLPVEVTELDWFLS
jgi:hypothetical protein